MYACPKHVRTDHPVLVYKTCEIEQTVLRLFSCLPPPLSPHKFTSLSQSFVSTLRISSSGSITSTSKPLSPPTALYKVVSRDNISTAYHPQTDRASERTDQALEQYLRAFCGTQQNNWHSWLPLAQYTKNSWLSATTKKTPFDLLIGYTPQAHQPTRKTDIPSMQEHLSAIEEARKAAQEAQRKAQESWITD